MNRIELNDAVLAEIEKVVDVAGYLWQREWAERNGGNISVDVTEIFGPAPTDLILPVASLADTNQLQVVGGGTVLGRDAIEVRLPFEQAEPLFPFLSLGGSWRPFFPKDRCRQCHNLNRTAAFHPADAPRRFHSVHHRHPAIHPDKMRTPRGKTFHCFLSVSGHLGLKPHHIKQTL